LCEVILQPAPSTDHALCCSLLDKIVKSNGVSHSHRHARFFVRDEITQLSVIQELAETLQICMPRNCKQSFSKKKKEL
jgi:hypothetical protein